MINKIQSYLEKYLGPIANFCNTNDVLLSIKDGFEPIMPLFLLGAFISLICDFPLWQVTNPAIGEFLWSIFRHPYTIVSSFVGLFSLLFISNSYSKRKNVDSAYGILIAVSTFLIFLDLNFDNNGSIIENVISVSSLGSQSIFISIILSTLSIKLFSIILKKNITIKLPESVPAGVQKSFASIIPIMIIIALSSLLRYGISLTEFGTLANLFNTIFGIPFMNVVGSPFGMILLYSFRNIFWFFGIHGPMVLVAFTEPLIQVLTSQNVEALASGLAAPNIISLVWVFVNKIFIIAPVISLLIFSKSKRYKTVGKVSFLPALFNISEPFIFGIPVVLNPYMMIPFILSVPIEMTISYCAISLGFCAVPTTMIPWTTPMVLANFIATNYDFRAIILDVIILIVLVLLYLPFIKLMDKSEEE